MTKFNREERYVVLKLADISDMLSRSESMSLIKIEEKILSGREQQGKLPLTCVVVEHDWPEYEPTWQAIEARVNKELGIGDL